jgi:hypothetical protein
MFITSGTLRRIDARLSPCTFSAYATFSEAVQLEVLEHAADVAAKERHLAVLQAREVAAADDDLAARRLDLLQEELDQRRLAGAGGADDEDEFPLVDRERDTVERRHVGLVHLRHVLEDDHRGRRRGTRVVELGRLLEDHGFCLQICQRL